MICLYCGCTDEKACVSGCHWVEPDVCSNCVISLTGVKKELEAYLGDPDVIDVEIHIIDKSHAHSRFKVIKPKSNGNKNNKRT